MPFRAVAATCSQAGVYICFRHARSMTPRRLSASITVHVDQYNVSRLRTANAPGLCINAASLFLRREFVQRCTPPVRLHKFDLVKTVERSSPIFSRKPVSTAPATAAASSTGPTKLDFRDSREGQQTRANGHIKTSISSKRLSVTTARMCIFIYILAIDFDADAEVEQLAPSSQALKAQDR